MNTKHTIGPWSYNLLNNCICDANGEEIIYGGRAGDLCITYPDARLIAAAPDQHDLIVEMYGWLRVNAGQLQLPQEMRSRMACFADDCKRIMAKATGEQP